MARVATVADARGLIAGVRAPRVVDVDVDGETVALTTPFPSPADWRDVWIYFLLVDRFDNPSALPKAGEWDTEQDTFQGGTLEGVRRRLPYLQQLGVGAVWVSPVQKNPAYDMHAYHGYGIQDFFAIDPRLASDPDHARRDPSVVEGELRRLVDEAHARGMYVIFDIVLNHAGDVFDYAGFGATAPLSDSPRTIRWRDAEGAARADWPEPPPDPSGDATVWPAELRRNVCFRREGNAFGPYGAREDRGDFFSLKELVTDLQDDGRFPVRDVLIAACQYLIARYDVDGFRVDTLKYVEPETARIVGNAIREYALSIGKRNFFTFGEVFDDEEKIARFIGRPVAEGGDIVGVDAALDFPLFYKLAGVVKGFEAPSALADMYERRKRVQRGVVSSHGEASRFFVTFLDNHDVFPRYCFTGEDSAAAFDAQVTLGLACLFALQGIPCLYYGTEQGLRGARDAQGMRGRPTRPEASREALWGKPGAFDLDHPFVMACRTLSDLRRSLPALRYGRQYFRPLSGDSVHFGLSRFPGGIVALSRILHDTEVLLVANTNTTDIRTVEVIVDRSLTPADGRFTLLYANREGATTPGLVVGKPEDSVLIEEVEGGVTNGPASALPVALRPMEVQVLRSGGP